MTSTRKLFDELQVVGAGMLFGSVSETYRMCGKASCVCHKEKARRHGPYLHVSYRQDGKTRGYYVEAARREQVLEGARAWERFQEIARELAERNRLALMGTVARRSKKGTR